MKKYFSFLFAVFVFIVPVYAVAELDLSGMSFDDLVELRNEILTEIMSRSDFKSVTVPAGNYIVGEDIPAGHYSLEISDGGYMAIVTVNTYTIHSISDGNGVGKITLKDGDSISIQASSIVMSTYTVLGF